MLFHFISKFLYFSSYFCAFLAVKQVFGDTLISEYTKEVPTSKIQYEDLTQSKQYQNQSLSKNYAPEYAKDLQGRPVPSLTATQSVGPGGLPLLTDTNFINQIIHFDHERIPERVVHAKGAGAHGYFETTHDITDHTKAIPFASVGKKTPVFVRFSGLIGEQGSADTIRTEKGIAVKFYTEDGNWDLLTSNIPVFPIREPLLYPSFIRSSRKRPNSNILDLTSAFDFITLRPETTHAIIYLASDIGSPKSYRYANYYAINAFKLVDSEGEFAYCKFHFISDQGLQSITLEDEIKLAGESPDAFIKDLFDAIEEKKFPSWTLHIQVMYKEQVETYRWNPFDATKLWSEDEYPLIPVGRLVLNMNPKNHFAEVEQSAFSAGALIPGIEPSPDPLLHGRLFSYPDTQSYRLGVNYPQLPINRPKNTDSKPIRTYVRDGACTVENGFDEVNYFPNSFDGPSVDPGARESVNNLEGTVSRKDQRDDDNFSQPKILWKGFLPGEKDRVIRNFASFLQFVSEIIQERVYVLLAKVDNDLSSGVRNAVRELSLNSTHPSNI